IDYLYLDALYLGRSFWLQCGNEATLKRDLVGGPLRDLRQAGCARDTREQPLVRIRRRDLVDDEHFHREPPPGFDFEAQGLGEIVHQAGSRVGYGNIAIGDLFDVDFVIDREVVYTFEPGGIDDEAIVVVAGKVVGQTRRRYGVAFNGDMI